MNEKLIEHHKETLLHVERVRALMAPMALEILDRAKIHDESKFREPEAPVFAEHTPELKATPYGTPEYSELLKKVQVAIDHHYSKNRHHPQFHKNGINDMTLLDLIEMLCDWIASSERTLNGNIRKSLEVNAKRFEMSEQLVKILENTVKEMEYQPRG